MRQFGINEFLVESSLPLPCAPRERSGPHGAAAERLAVRHEGGCLRAFSHVSLIGRRAGGTLRSYDAGGGVLVCVADCVRLHVDPLGGAVTLDFEPSSEEAPGYATACTVNLGASLCTLLRGRLPLHGASVELAGRRVVIMAPSGAGKTTLLWRLLDDGARFANDDVVPVWTEAGRAVASPSGGLHAKLSGAALVERGMDPSSYERMLLDWDEFWVPIPPEDRARDPQPLAALFVLRPGGHAGLFGRIAATPLGGGAALGALMEHTQGLWAVYPLLDARKMFGLYQALAERVPIYALAYFRCREILPDLARVIREMSGAPASAAVAPAAGGPVSRFPFRLRQWVRGHGAAEAAGG